RGRSARRGATEAEQGRVAMSPKAPGGMEGRVAPARDVLIADDEPHMRRLLRRALSDRRQLRIVGEAADGKQALEIILRPSPDVALVDLNMPVLDGIATIRELRKTTMQTRTLVLTAMNDREAISAAIEAGADGYVLKGCGAPEIREAVRTV